MNKQSKEKGVKINIMMTKGENYLEQEKQKFKEFLKKVEDPNYQREINRSLSPNATDLQVAKYKLCKKMLIYQQENNLSDEEIAKKIKLSIAEVEDILFCEIEKFTLDRLTEYASKLFAPYRLEINIQLDKVPSHAQI